MNPGKRFSNRWSAGLGILALLLALTLPGLACALPGQSSDTARQTDIALGVQQTLLAQTAQAISAAANQPTAAPMVVTATPEPPTPGPAPIADQPTSPPPPGPAPTQANANPPGPSSVAASIPITQFKLYQFAEAHSGCKVDSMTCWVQNMSGAGSWKTNKPVEGSLSSAQAVAIDPAWVRPYLVYTHQLALSNFNATVQLKVGGEIVTVRIYEKSNTAWLTESIDLSPYKGKEVQIIFYSNLAKFVRSATSLMRIEWKIQDVQIVPDYAP